MKHPEIVHIGDTAYQVGREVRSPWFKDAINHHGANTITEKMGYDKLLRSKNGTYLLVYEIQEANVIEYDELDMQTTGSTKTEQEQKENI